MVSADNIMIFGCEATIGVDVSRGVSVEIDPVLPDGLYKGNVIGFHEGFLYCGGENGEVSRKECYHVDPMR